MRYRDVKGFVQGTLDDNAIVATIDPGPASDEDLLDLSPGRIVFLTVGGGAGLALEAQFDRPFIDLRCIGEQGDYSDAENLAVVLDLAFIRLGSNFSIGPFNGLYVTRTGGGPTLDRRDSGNRYHLTCSYVTQTKSGV